MERATHGRASASSRGRPAATDGRRRRSSVPPRLVVDLAALELHLATNSTAAARSSRSLLRRFAARAPNDRRAASGSAWFRASPSPRPGRPDRTTDESQGPGTRFWARISGSYRSRVVLGGPQIASCGVGFGGAVVDWRDSARFLGARGRRRRLPASWRGCGVSVRVRVGASRWRVEAQASGACGPPRDVALRGPCYACPGVTLAPTFAGPAGSSFAFAGLAACQSRTVCV